jgi:hypothetical protein
VVLSKAVDIFPNVAGDSVMIQTIKKSSKNFLFFVVDYTVFQGQSLNHVEFFFVYSVVVGEDNQEGIPPSSLARDFSVITSPYLMRHK